MRRSCVRNYGGIVAVLALTAGCERSTPPRSAEAERQGNAERLGGVSRTIEIRSPAFGHNTAIPGRFTGDGDDVSPQLAWSGVPEAAKELALICDDTDAPGHEPWVHWVVCRIHPTATGLPENVPRTETLIEPAGALQGNNSWGRIGYGGPAPPPGSGAHHYHFKLYALDTVPDVSPGLTKAQLLAAMQGHIIGQGELVGTYQR